MLKNESVNILPARVYMYVCMCVYIFMRPATTATHTHKCVVTVWLFLLSLTPKKEKLVSEQNSFLFIVFFFQSRYWPCLHSSLNLFDSAS